MIATYLNGVWNLLVSTAKYTSFLLVFLLSNECAAEPAPPAFEELLVNEKLQGSVIYLDSLSKAQKELFWENKVVSPEGYFSVKSSIAYINLISEFEDKFSKLSPSIKKCSKVKGFDETANLQETPLRITRLFKPIKNKTHRILFTSWQFVTAGARIVIPVEFLNFSLGQNTGTISLAVGPGTFRKALWKATWIENDFQYEFYMEENGRPLEYNKSQLLSIANLIKESCS